MVCKVSNDSDEIITLQEEIIDQLKEQASKIMGMPVRISQPNKLSGMADNLQSPAFSTSVGLLRWALLMSEVIPHKDKYSIRERNYGQNITLEKIMSWLRRLLP